MGSLVSVPLLLTRRSLQVLEAPDVRDVLSLMYSCGMYNYSGEFAFTVTNRQIIKK